MTDGSLDARLERAQGMGRRRTEAMINLEARHPFAQSTPVVAHRLVGKNDDEIDVGDTREAAFRRTAEQDQTHRSASRSARTPG